jgi:hypothetical protein
LLSRMTGLIRDENDRVTGHRETVSSTMQIHLEVLCKLTLLREQLEV